MKIAMLADLHLNKSAHKEVLDKSSEFRKVPFRHADFMRAFMWSIDKILNLNPDLVVINGDIYDHPDPSNKVRGFFSGQLRRLLEKNIRTLILIGNHDVSQETHSLADIQELKLGKLIVISNPTTTVFKNDNDEKVQLVLLPYSVDVEQKKTTIKESFYKLVEDQKNEKPYPRLFCGHFAVKGQKMNSYEVEEGGALLSHAEETKTKDFLNNSKKDISSSDLDKIDADYIFLGDFHEMQRLKCKTKGWYGGSLEKNNFNERSQQKGFLFYDSSYDDEKMGNCRFIKNPYCRPMLQLEGTLTDMKKQFASIDVTEWQNAIVRLKFIGTKKEMIDFSTGESSFKNEVVEKLNAIHMYHDIGKVLDEDAEMIMSRIEKEIDEHGVMEETDVMDVVEEIIDEREKDEKEKEILMEMATDVYKKTMGKRK